LRIRHFLASSIGQPAASSAPCAVGLPRIASSEALGGSAPARGRTLPFARLRGARAVLVAGLRGRLVRALASGRVVAPLSSRGSSSLRSASGLCSSVDPRASCVGDSAVNLWSPNTSFQRTSGLACGQPCRR
jgi:hypothetical protein